MPVPIPGFNFAVDIAETIRAIREIRDRQLADWERRQDKALVELGRQLEIAETVVARLESMFIVILEGYKSPQITGNSEALQSHLKQTRNLLESRQLLPHLETAHGTIKAAASSSKFKRANYREMVEGLEDLDEKLSAWRLALGPGAITGPGVWRLQELCVLAERQLAASPQPVNPEIAKVAEEAYNTYNWRLSADIRMAIAQVRINS